MNNTISMYVLEWNISIPTPKSKHGPDLTCKPDKTCLNKNEASLSFKLDLSSTCCLNVPPAYLK